MSSSRPPRRPPPHVTVRELDSGDYDAVIRLASELDLAERYLRFLTRYPTYIGQWALSLTTPSDDACALGAFEAQELIGIADYVESTDGGCAEVAVVVAHEQHQRGIGTLLLYELGRRAQAAGLHCLVGMVLAENSPMLEVINDAGWPVDQRRDGDVVRVRVALDNAGSGLAHHDDRGARGLDHSPTD
ncbi:GNAT family N-acetyltransferase [Mycobacterium sp. SMC-4]|uniref:GNAT family N-acetyltransferase n=1 Tax=Mycobacterium sp. SMC-4 TaxID=2857059 RepID=UPI0021B4C9C4|nr:GNAT family N-acetyltransferase [Mycobacterium sp. SMC-4]